jgi:hypothetical protein
MDNSLRQLHLFAHHSDDIDNPETNTNVNCRVRSTNAVRCTTYVASIAFDVKTFVHRHDASRLIGALDIGKSRSMVDANVRLMFLPLRDKWDTHTWRIAAHRYCKCQSTR